MLIERYGRRALVRNQDQVLPECVGDLINGARRPPHFRGPLRESLARIHPRAFWIAWRTFFWEPMAHLSCRIGPLGMVRKGMVRKLKVALASARWPAAVPQFARGEDEVTALHERG